jgi:hypothetical protein
LTGFFAFFCSRRFTTTFFFFARLTARGFISSSAAASGTSTEEPVAAKLTFYHVGHGVTEPLHERSFLLFLCHHLSRSWAVQQGGSEVHWRANLVI